MVNSARIELFGRDVAKLFLGAEDCSRGEGDKLDSIRFSGVSTDSRTAGEGELFFALVGDNFDGHDFVVDAVKRGAAGVVVEKSYKSKLSRELGEKGKGVPLIAVYDTLYALGELARFHRGRMKARVVGITGSNGKTTTKEITASIAETKFVTRKSEGNFNNLIGLPMMLLATKKEDEVIVLEMGMNVPGEMARLSEIAGPEIGVITNIGPVHLEGVGSIEGVIEEKGRLVESLPEDGTAVINGDCVYCRGLIDKIKSRVITFGIEGEADVTAVDVEDMGGDGIKAKFIIPSGAFHARLKIPGIHNIKNGLAAASVGVALGIPADDIKTGIEAIKPMKMRMEMIMTGDGVVILNDSYNANPVSMKAAISFLAGEARRKGGRLIVVLGDMLELGGYTIQGHEEVGMEAAKLGAGYLFALGNNAVDIARGAGERGMPPERIFTYPVGGHERLIEDLMGVIGPKDRVLVKGSRGMRMEIVVSGISSPAA
ncbi:MAG: UDP-N-acetylmuramoyl-tripeptide--D-alanyl-D-alanine ligase [Deltaproteobacteria bacterium]|uniref:UDP-N-acetylmuramoyl-tripeptide--D-alanyl-D-alanine ligase n=1 Tax=Candidatus Zymogenus saltonus TaxID=2844893 RepID=A0A9D8KGU1_9DELT|nr:UDP-N-acetylmuramoyl-tripeptide--D-alanyl-D-alanine ligase [Candidatus Zymogenus saltonus]